MNVFAYITSRHLYRLSLEPLLLQPHYIYTPYIRTLKAICSCSGSSAQMCNPVYKWGQAICHTCYLLTALNCVISGGGFFSGSSQSYESYKDHSSNMYKDVNIEVIALENTWMFNGSLTYGIWNVNLFFVCVKLNRINPIDNLITWTSENPIYITVLIEKDAYDLTTCLYIASMVFIELITRRSLMGLVI